MEITKEELKERRSSLVPKVSQEKLAELWGYSFKYVNGLENGKELIRGIHHWAMLGVETEWENKKAESGDGFCRRKINRDY